MDRSTRPSFNFVNLQHPDDLKDEETQLRIRRLAMREVGKSRRRLNSNRKGNELTTDIYNRREDRLDFDRFSSGSIDPFGPYPIQLDESSQALLANIFSHNTNHSSQLRGSWYPVGLSCAATFHNVLSNSQNFIFEKLHGHFPAQDNAQALTHHHTALRLANEMINDPTKYMSDETVGTVASFMCHHSLLGSFAGGEWHKHRNALINIVELRGGFAAIDQENLRITLSWVDLVGSFSQDITPLVPLPRKWEANSKSPPNSPRAYSPISLIWKQRLPMQMDWITIFDDMAHLISLDHAFNEEQLTLAITSGSWMEPTIWRLLVIRPLLHGHVIEEVLRLGTLLFLAPVWRVLGQSPVWTAGISGNLLRVLMGNMVEWNELKPALVWVLYFATIETKNLSERNQFVLMMAVMMSGMQIREWDELMQVVRSVLWVEVVFSGSEELVRDEVMQIAQHNPTMNGW
ncbi:hypothetical protein P153DRAFT_348731 [Dothidotthia symphoricarpi CBS 119687]|uniref:Tachykinin family protein n=1 Tax=Dothidotthia symphoricarpi CBS 119687 TaxID=1392245 RepID=A0A6A6A0I1_9PLEO|nr:uncharacterized protein P153DRAFT_348731 [Dothidotthia symphoricarpi CBS 119687]KAF2125502.1 hypothetical protein P153DRAFT_348731 [Dothidotthia symphoricarpi CBS 119687]